ncbi:DUF6801 domain-containing protein [Nocardioides sp.]|uniref:DUF6801 domain-containing protein n=1 Tax=Nocardioides sp. TaxID=35761 RepID=UPI0039E5FA9E
MSPVNSIARVAAALTLGAMALGVPGPAEAATGAKSYECYTSWEELYTTPFEIPVEVDVDLPTTASSGGAVSATAATVTVTAPQELLEIATDEGYTQFKVATSNFAVNSTFGSTEGVHNLGSLASGWVAFGGTSDEDASASGTIPAISLPSGWTGTGAVRTPDNDNVTDPWYASGASSTETVAFTTTITVREPVYLLGTQVGWSTQDVLFRCGTDGETVQGTTIESIAVS